MISVIYHMIIRSVCRIDNFSSFSIGILVNERPEENFFNYYLVLNTRQEFNGILQLLE